MSRRRWAAALVGVWLVAMLGAVQAEAAAPTWQRYSTQNTADRSCPRWTGPAVVVRQYWSRTTAQADHRVTVDGLTARMIVTPARTAVTARPQLYSAGDPWLPRGITVRSVTTPRVRTTSTVIVYYGHHYGLSDRTRPHLTVALSWRTQRCRVTVGAG